LKRIRRAYAPWGALNHPNILNVEGVIYIPDVLQSPGVVYLHKPEGDLLRFMAEANSFDRLSMVPIAASVV
jgi:hypothetical protein